MQKFLLIGLLALGLLLAGCAGQAPSAPSASTSANTTSAAPTPAGQVKSNATTSPTNNSQVTSMTKNPIVVFETTKGTFKAEIYVAEAPITGNNFMKLVRSKFYDNLTFHRVEPGFVVQGGDPSGDGTGGSPDKIELEIKPTLRHKLGALGMARSQDRNSASSQFYFVTGPASFLDGNYAVFGQVQGSGMDIVQTIKVGDRMTKVYEEK